MSSVLIRSDQTRLNFWGSQLQLQLQLSIDCILSSVAVARYQKIKRLQPPPPKQIAWLLGYFDFSFPTRNSLDATILCAHHLVYFTRSDSLSLASSR
ncbi:hypothetical protein NXS19_000635 [Fusarium pseudograminearum]|nr:hypothetical protein NXS19_000635 [Fusarium pseudograminearum]